MATLAPPSSAVIRSSIRYRIALTAVSERTTASAPARSAVLRLARAAVSCPTTVADISLMPDKMASLTDFPPSLAKFLDLTGFQEHQVFGKVGNAIGDPLKIVGYKYQLRSAID